MMNVIMYPPVMSTIAALFLLLRILMMLQTPWELIGVLLLNLGVRHPVGTNVRMVCISMGITTLPEEDILRPVGIRITLGLIGPISTT